MSLRSLAALVLAWSALSGCSAIVGDPLDPTLQIRCEIIDGVDPCPERSSCVDFYCSTTFDACNGVDDDADGAIDEGSAIAAACDGEARCVSGACMTGCSNEICNGDDDDCDGMMDEGLDVDLDMDRVSACPTNDDPPDCDDSNSSVHPENRTLGVLAAIETCNGLDDDCNSETRETDGICGADVCERLPGAASPACVGFDDCRRRSMACTGNQVCDTVTRRCSAPPADCREPDQECPSPLVCSGAGTCEQPPPGAIGDGCNEGSECASKLCLPREAMLLSSPSGGQPTGICGMACCSNEDCGAGQRCWAPGTGARSCVTAAVYGDATAELCSVPEDCAGSCRLGSATYTAGSGTQSFDGMICMGAVSGGTQQICVFSECSDGVCLTNGACANPCGSTADCDRQYSDAFEVGYYRPVCDYRLSSGSVITGCFEPPTTGTGTTGMACTGNAGCRDGFCVSGQCADVCCNDASCPGANRCAPIGATIGAEDVWFMLCVPDDTTPD